MTEDENKYEFFESCRPYNKKLYNYIFKYVNNHDAAEDILQDTLLAAMVSFEKFKERHSEAKIEPWLYKVAHNIAMKYFKENGKYDLWEKDDYIKEAEVTEKLELKSFNKCEEHVLDKEVYAVLKKYIETLSPDEKDFIYSCYFLNISLKSYAESKEINYNTMVSIHQRLLKKLKSKLSAEDIELFSKYGSTKEVKSL